MRKKIESMLLLSCLLISSYLPMMTTACDADACNIGTSAAVGVGCAAASAAVGCALTGWWTFGLGCVVGPVACTAVGTAASSGKLILCHLLYLGFHLLQLKGILSTYI